MNAQANFSTGDPANAKVVDVASGTTQYTIKTSFNRDATVETGKVVTTIVDVQGATVAEWKRKWGREPSRVTIRGQTTLLLDWIVPSSSFSR